VHKLADWKSHSNGSLFIPFKRLAVYVMNQIEASNSMPLLSTPTHDPCWIDPVIFVKRLAQYQFAGLTPNATDWHIGIARVNLEDTKEAIILAKKILTGEYRAMTIFLLDQAASPSMVKEHPEEWLMCAYTKNPLHYYKEFAAFAPGRNKEKRDHYKRSSKKKFFYPKSNGCFFI